MTMSLRPSPLTSAIVGDELRSHPLELTVHDGVDDTVAARRGLRGVNAATGATSATVRRREEGEYAQVTNLYSLVHPLISARRRDERA